MDLHLRKWNIASGTSLSRYTVRKYPAASIEDGVVREIPVPIGEKINLLMEIIQSGPRHTRTSSKEVLAPRRDDQFDQRRLLLWGEFYCYFQ